MTENHDDSEEFYRRRLRDVGSPRPLDVPTEDRVQARMWAAFDAETGASPTLIGPARRHPQLNERPPLLLRLAAVAGLFVIVSVGLLAVVRSMAGPSLLESANDGIKNSCADLVLWGDAIAQYTALGTRSPGDDLIDEALPSAIDAVRRLRTQPGISSSTDALLLAAEQGLGEALAMRDDPQAFRAEADAAIFEANQHLAAALRTLNEPACSPDLLLGEEP